MLITVVLEAVEEVRSEMKSERGLADALDETVRDHKDLVVVPKFLQAQ